MAANIRHSSESTEHFTPQDIVEAARKVMGSIDLDPASCELANEYINAASFFTLEQNGYMQKWFGRVFLNPPGGWCDGEGHTVVKKSKSHGEACEVSGSCGLPPGHVHKGSRQSSQAAWWFKLASEYAKGHVKEAIFVCFSVELLQTSQGIDGCPSLPHDYALCFPRTRLQYLHEGKDGHLYPGTQPPHSSMLVHLPQRSSPTSKAHAHRSHFEVEFEKFGRVITPR